MKANRRRTTNGRLETCGVGPPAARRRPLPLVGAVSGRTCRLQPGACRLPPIGNGYDSETFAAAFSPSPDLPTGRQASRPGRNGAIRLRQRATPRRENSRAKQTQFGEFGEFSHCGLRIANCGLTTTEDWKQQSPCALNAVCRCCPIRNSQSAIRNRAKRSVLAVLGLEVGRLADVGAADGDPVGDPSDDRAQRDGWIAE